LGLLVKYGNEFGLKIWAYCLMTNHLHLLAVPEADYSLAKGIGRTNLLYTQHVNKRYGRSGRLWQNRFFSCPIQRDVYLWAAVRYIEQNPVRAGLVKRPWDYQWSSARHWIEGYSDPVLLGADWLDPNQREEYRKFLSQQDEGVLAHIRKATSTGRPLGTPEFIKNLEIELQRSLHPKKAGRPKKRGQ
jgi:putative transposase